MTVQGLGWLGVRTERFAETVALYRHVLPLEPFHADEASVRSRPGDGTELHVYGLAAEDAAAARERLEEAGIALVTELERDGDAAWCYFEGPDGNVYEVSSGPGRRP